MTRHRSIWAAAAAAAGALLCVGQAQADDYPGESTWDTTKDTTKEAADKTKGAASDAAGAVKDTTGTTEKSTETLTETTTVTTPPPPATPQVQPAQPVDPTMQPASAYSEDARRDLLMPPEPKGGSKDTHLVTGFGMALSIGGGVTDFTASEARGATDLGGSYGARLTLGTRLPFAVEVAYVGSAQGMDVLGLDTSAILLGNGGEATLRLNFATGPVEPYIFGGAGLTHYSVENEDFNTSAVQDSDDIYTAPMGAGVAMQYKGLVVDGRGTFRYAFNEDLLGEDAKLHTWGANVNVGFEF